MSTISSQTKVTKNNYLPNLFHDCLLCFLLLCQVDRIYLNSPNVIAVLDHERKRTYVLRKEGLPDIGKLCWAVISPYIVCEWDVTVASWTILHA